MKKYMFRIVSAILLALVLLTTFVVLNQNSAPQEQAPTGIVIN